MPRRFKPWTHPWRICRARLNRPIARLCLCARDEGASRYRKVLTMDEARRIAANIAKLPTLPRNEKRNERVLASAGV